MDKVIRYRKLIEDHIQAWVDLDARCPSKDIETVGIYDEVCDHYLLMRVGWEGQKHVQYITLYVRIKDGKIWVETDWTEEGIANQLLQAGVPNDDIVLGFQHPTMRPYTDFAA